MISAPLPSSLSNVEEGYLQVEEEEERSSISLCRRDDEKRKKRGESKRTVRRIVLLLLRLHQRTMSLDSVIDSGLGEMDAHRSVREKKGKGRREGKERTLILSVKASRPPAFRKMVNPLGFE